MSRYKYKFFLNIECARVEKTPESAVLFPKLF